MSPRVDLPFVKKIELIKDSKRCLSQGDLAAKYKIPTGIAFNILKGKEQYLDDFESNQCNNAKRKIDDETYSGFVAQRAKDLPI
jgi:hypothetical protein